MDLDEWDAPYTSPLRGFLKLVGTGLLLLAVLVAFVVVRGLIGGF